MYEYLDSDNTNYRTVGSFAIDKNEDFKAGIKNLMEGFKSTYQMDAVSDISRILQFDTMKEAYKDMLLADVVESAIDDPYYASMPEKLEQLFENTSMEMLAESSVAALSPIVGISLPVLKKSYIEGHSKDIVMTEVPTKPIIKAAFERRFLKDEAGNKHYIPEIFYDNSYKTIMNKGKGKAVSSAYYPTASNLPMQDFDILTASGGSIQTRDSLAMNFCVKSVMFDVDGTSYPVAINAAPDMASGSTIHCKVKAPTANAAGVILEDHLVGSVDFYSGKVSLASTAGYIKKVQFGGNLSNENNTETIELDRERELMEWKIPDGTRINTGLTIEKIKDYKALFDFDITTQVISDMSTCLTQYEDSEILNFLTDSFDSWKTRGDLPFGYTGGFTREGWFSCEPPANKYVTRSQWIDTELKFDTNRFIDELKVLLREQDLMFVVYGHPNNITLIQDNVRWIIDENTKIGGIALDYRFGVMTANKNRIHVISTLKCPKDRGLRVVAYPLSKDVITFKHYKYSLNIENAYRNKLTPLTPNVMATSRFLTTEVLPVQGELHIVDNQFALNPINTDTAAAGAPIITNGSGTVTAATTDYPNGYPVVTHTATAGATLYYTTDGTIPSATNGTAVPATGVINVTESSTVKIVATKAGFLDSAVSELTIEFTGQAVAAAPIVANGKSTITAPAADFTNGYPVTAYCTTEDAVMYYTVDGTVPSATNGTQVPDTGVITVTDSATVNVVATKEGYLDSTVSSVVVNLTA